MKKQMKANLFIAGIGCCLLGAFLMSATGKDAAATAQQSQKATMNTVAFAAPQVPGVPFTFFYSLVTTFTNGGSVKMNLVGEEAQSPIWDKPAGWGRVD